MVFKKEILVQVMGTVELVGEIKVAPAGNGHEVIVGALSGRGWAPHQVAFLRVLFYLDEKIPDVHTVVGKKEP